MRNCMNRTAALALLSICITLLLLRLCCADKQQLGAGTTWHACGPAGVPVKVEDVHMSPDPLMCGQNFTLLMPAHTSEKLEGGEVDVTIYYFYVPLRTQTEDLCDKADCPVAPGSVTFRHVQRLPAVTPPGWYQVRLNATDNNRAALFCTDVHLWIGCSSFGPSTPHKPHPSSSSPSGLPVVGGRAPLRPMLIPSSSNPPSLLLWLRRLAQPFVGAQ